MSEVECFEFELYNLPEALLYYITLYYITLHLYSFHYITLHYITLHYITLHYITFHYITFLYNPLHLDNGSHSNITIKLMTILLQK